MPVRAFSTVIPWYIRPSETENGTFIMKAVSESIRRGQHASNFKTAADIKELFDIIAEHRDRVEQEIGFPLLWDRERGRYESHIAVERDDMDPRDVGEWNRQHAWLSELVTAFERVIRPHIAKLPPTVET
jgi:hypothetical protein